MASNISQANPTSLARLHLVDQPLRALPTEQRRILLDVKSYLEDQDSDRASIWSAQQTLIQECMARQRHDYSLVAYSPIKIDLLGGFGPASQRDPTTPAQAGGQSADPNAEGFNRSGWRDAYSDDSTEVVFDLPGGGQGGSVTGGCLGESLRYLYGPDLGPPVRAEMVALNLLPSIIKMAIESKPVRDAVASRDACILTSEGSAAGKAPQPRRAADDIEQLCSQNARLPDAYAQAFAHAARLVLDRSTTILAEWQHYRIEAIRRAHSMNGHGYVLPCLDGQRHRPWTCDRPQAGESRAPGDASASPAVALHGVGQSRIAPERSV